MTQYVLWYSDLGMSDVEIVGGKNASLGEMISHLSKAGVSVPNGFATSAAAYREFLAHEGLDARIKTRLESLDVNDVRALAEAGQDIRGWIRSAPRASKASSPSARTINIRRAAANPGSRSNARSRRNSS